MSFDRKKRFLDETQGTVSFKCDDGATFTLSLWDGVALMQRLWEDGYRIAEKPKEPESTP